MPLRPTCLVRAGVRLSARLWARCDRAATARAGCALARSAPRAKGSTGAMSRGAATHGCPVTLVASGRSGAGWGWSQGLPLVKGGLGGALRRQRRRFSFRDFSAACPPPGPQVPEVRLGPNFARFLERCPLDSEFSCDHFLSFESMFFLRSSNPFDGWFSLPPPRHGP